MLPVATNYIKNLETMQTYDLWSSLCLQVAPHHEHELIITHSVLLCYQKVQNQKEEFRFSIIMCQT